MRGIAYPHASEGLHWIANLHGAAAPMRTRAPHNSNRKTAFYRDRRMSAEPLLLVRRTTWLRPLTEIEILPDVSNSGL